MSRFPHFRWLPWVMGQLRASSRGRRRPRTHPPHPAAVRAGSGAHRDLPARRRQRRHDRRRRSGQPERRRSRALHSARDAAVWAQTVAHAESVMEQTKLGAPVGAATSPDGFRQAVTQRPTALPGVQEIAVTVTAPNGRTFTLSRLVSAR